MSLKDIHKIYFVGIGGIGMSAIARYFNHRNVEVHGYDKTETTLTKKLVDEGMKIHYEDNIDFIPQGIDLVVYTPAVPLEHSELKYFFDHKYRVKKRAEVLGILSQNRKTIAIAGTHGKTTTSCILTHLLKVGGIDCTAFLGGIAQDFQSNFVDGKSDWMIVEADEYDRSFLHLHPDIATVLSMDADHLDIYGDLVQMHEAFYDFANQLKEKGLLFVRENLPFNKAQKNKLTYGIGAGKFKAETVRVEKGYFVFDYKSPKEDIDHIRFTLPGKHNVENAVVAIAVAQYLGVKSESIKKALASFKGIKRRFEFVCRTKEVVFINDYAHHPTELKAAISAARDLFPDRKITGIFQPHLYSRTQDFVNDFAMALDALDEVLLMDIYPARELPIEGVSSKIIFDKMKNQNKVLVNKTNLLSQVEKLETEVLLTLGAGDIDTFVDPIKRIITNEKY